MVLMLVRQHTRDSLLVDLFIDVEGNTSILDSIELTFLYDSIGEPTSRMTVRTNDTCRLLAHLCHSPCIRVGMNVAGNGTEACFAHACVL